MNKLNPLEILKKVIGGLFSPRHIVGTFLVTLTLFMYFVMSGSAEASGIAKEPIGTVYEVQENDLLEVIMAKLQHMEATGQMAEMEAEFKENVMRTIKTPPGVDLPRALKTKTKHYDPSFTVKESIFLPDGRLLHPAGTVINPLTVRSMTKRMIFIDQRDAEQVAWAKKKYEESGWRDKVILVNGSYQDLMKEWKKPVYYDQLGVGQASKEIPGMATRETMVRKFNIESLPAIIYQTGITLRIDEVAI